MHVSIKASNVRCACVSMSPLQIAREYNEKSRGSNLGDDVLQEWAVSAAWRCQVYPW